jgi:hypothetical protein
LFTVLTLSAAPPRQADHDVHEAITEEAPLARRAMLAELGWLTPALLAGAAAGLAVAYWPAAGDVWRGLTGWSPGWGLRPLAGAAYAVHGAIVAAAAGWLVRIVFTLAFAREAFGTGDIFILAAAGACGGADVALWGFLAAIGLALAGWLLSLLVKRAVMIQFGPPLALGFLVALWLNQPAAALFRDYAESVAAAARERPDLLLAFLGVLLAGGVAAVYLSRLVRMVLEPRE